MVKDIEIYVEQLPSTPGWVKFSDPEKAWMQEHTSNALTAFRDSALKAIAFCVEVGVIEKFLGDRDAMTMTDWFRTCFGKHERTGRRWLASYRQMRGVATDEDILYLAQEGLAGVNSSLQPGELIPVLKQLPAPESANKKAREQWRQKVAETLRSRRSQRRKRRTPQLTQDEAVLAIVLKIRQVLREAKFGSTTIEAAVLRKSMGYGMQLRGIPRSITAERTPIPDGFLPRQGRPPKQPPAHKKES